MIRFHLSTLVLVFALIPSAGRSAEKSGETDSAEKLQAVLKARPNHVKARERLGEIYMKKKDYKQVIAILAPYNNEISEKALINLANAYGATNDSENEIRMLKIYEASQPKRFRPHYLLGMAYRRAKKTDEAIEHFRKSIDFAPSHRPSYNHLLEIFIELKNNYETRILLTTMLKRFGEKPDILAHLCKAYATDGFLKEAISTCKNAVQLDPRTPENHIYLGQAYYDQGNKNSAERIFRTAARQFSKSEFVQYATGTYYATEKNHPAAVRYLKEAAKLDPKSVRSHLTLAQSLFATKDFKTALIHFEQACKLDETKESWLEFENAGARLIDEKPELGAEFQKRASVCRR